VELGKRWRKMEVVRARLIKGESDGEKALTHDLA
jgi:hypothetical protein